MTQEALKLALDALETELSIDWGNPDDFDTSAEKMHKAITAIKEALAQPVQEYESVLIDGVAYTIPNKVAVEILGLHLDLLQLKQEQESVAKYSDIVSDGGLDPRNKFDTPPQRTWVGLTDVEIDYLLGSTAGENEETHISFARAIEAKLKQKNGYAEEKNT